MDRSIGLKKKKKKKKTTEKYINGLSILFSGYHIWRAQVHINERMQQRASEHLIDLAI